jgi:hypothetical protein
MCARACIGVCASMQAWMTSLNQTVPALILCTKDLQISIVYRQNIKASLFETNVHFLEEQSMWNTEIALSQIINRLLKTKQKKVAKNKTKKGNRSFNLICMVMSLK